MPTSFLFFFFTHYRQNTNLCILKQLSEIVWPYNLNLLEQKLNLKLDIKITTLPVLDLRLILL